MVKQEVEKLQQAICSVEMHWKVSRSVEKRKSRTRLQRIRMPSLEIRLPPALVFPIFFQLNIQANRKRKLLSLTLQVMVTHTAPSGFWVTVTIITNCTRRFKTWSLFYALIKSNSKIQHNFSSTQLSNLQVISRTMLTIKRKYGKVVCFWSIRLMKMHSVWMI